MADLTKHIDATALTTFEVDPDGERVHFHVRDQQGSPSRIARAVACSF